MEEQLNQLLALSPVVIYLILFVSSYFENVIPPIPGDTVTVFGAYLVGIKHLNFPAVLLLTTVGSFLGFMTLYAIGRRYGRDFFYSRDFRFFKRDKFQQVERWFGKYGYLLILANRFLSGIRSVISIFSGIAGLRPGRVAICALLSGAIWNLILITAGYLLGTNWPKVIHFIKNYNYFALGVGIVILLAILWNLRRGRSRQERPE